MSVPDLRIPSAPKRILWQEAEVANTVINGFMIQVAVGLDGVILFGGNQPVFRLVMIAEGDEEFVLFEDYTQGGAKRLTLAEADDVCRTSQMSVEGVWRGSLDLSERMARGWKRHRELWRQAHPLTMVAPQPITWTPLAHANHDQAGE